MMLMLALDYARFASFDFVKKIVRKMLTRILNDERKFDEYANYLL